MSWPEHEYFIADELKEFLTKYKALVEETYYMNDNTKVVLLGHSMGNPITLYLLNHVSEEWKNKFIKSFISLAGVWGGAAKSIRLMITGNLTWFFWFLWNSNIDSDGHFVCHHRWFRNHVVLVVGHLR